jgi:uncharacterized protein (UPF0335 family)
MKNNQINKIKKRTDTLADYIVNKAERLERYNHELETRGREIYLELREHELAFEKALDRITEIKKDKRNNNITIIFKGKNNNDDTDTLFTDFTQDEPLYPLAEMLLEKYEKKVEFERLIEKAKKNPKFTYIRQKGE